MPLIWYFSTGRRPDDVVAAPELLPDAGTENEGVVFESLAFTAEARDANETCACPQPVNTPIEINRGVVMIFINPTSD